MKRYPRQQSLATWLAAGGSLAAAVYAACVAVTWYRYGKPCGAGGHDRDACLDRFMPVFDVVERHHVRVEAPAALTLAAAKELELSRLLPVRAIFKARELILGAAPDTRARPRGILEETRGLGWVILDEEPDREVVVGAVTKPWEPNVTFRSILPDLFFAFTEPGYVKIAWTLRADPIDETTSTFRTETRALATDAEARRKFRRYWAFLSPGIVLIRWLSLAPLKAEAERRASGPSIAASPE